jgi:4-hydroxy-3-polyprenylbenzoate decarboxylase
MPLSLIDIRNMETLALAGATICSPNPGFYLNPKRVEDIVDFTVGKVLDLLGVEHDLRTRWEHHEGDHSPNRVGGE